MSSSLSLSGGIVIEKTWSLKYKSSLNLEASTSFLRSRFAAAIIRPLNCSGFDDPIGVYSFS